MIKKKDPPRVNKTALAKEMKVSRSSLYYKSKMDIKDTVIKEQILSVLEEHKSYGHKRIAIALCLNKKRILRIMKKFNIKPYRRRIFKRKKNDEKFPEMKYINCFKLLCPIQNNAIWASDFTYMKFQGKFYYFATIIDVFTKEIKGFSFSNRHDTSLITQALRNALENNKAPQFLHSDQGSEYRSEQYTSYAQSVGITISMSAKGKPWENGFQESFYSQFKVDLGQINRFDFLGELIEALYLQVYYYNNKRIHTSIKMPPALFAKQCSLISNKVF